MKVQCVGLRVRGLASRVKGIGYGVERFMGSSCGM